MNISSLTSTSQVGQLNGPGRGHRPNGPPPDGGPSKVVAVLTGLSTDEVATQLASGSSLAEVAEGAGVDRDELTAALVDNAPPRLEASGDVESIVSQMIDKAGGPERRGRPDGPPPPPPGGGNGSATGALTGSTTARQDTMLEAIANLLETDPNSVVDQLRNGTNLADMLDQAGASKTDFLGGIERGLLFDDRA
ncbi:MAG: hypothetical protein AAFO29_08955 [Actinomycetota bacterium]